MKLFNIIFTSTPSMLCTDSDIMRIINKSRDSNATQGISGLLLFCENQFFSVLEGDEATIKKTLKRIRCDKRHENMRILVSGPLPERQFDTWKTAFPVKTRQDLEDLKYLNHDFNFRLEGLFSGKPSLSLAMAKSFLRNGRLLLLF